MKVRIQQQYDAEIWQDMKAHYEAELWLCQITEYPNGEAVLVWTFELDKAGARRLGVMLEMVAGLGNPQTGLDMKPTKAELA